MLGEHQYSVALVETEIPVVAPVEIKAQTLLAHDSYRFSIFPYVDGRASDLKNRDQLKRLIRLLGRLHMVGAERPFVRRPTLDIETFGSQSRQLVLESDLLPYELKPVYEKLTLDLLQVTIALEILS